jgi:hypothetical protein
VSITSPSNVERLTAPARHTERAAVAAPDVDAGAADCGNLKQGER